MKIAWFSPRVPMHSDIANFTARLEPELRRRFDARFLTEDSTGFHEPAAGKSYPAPFGQTSAELLRSLNEVDVPIYNLGNNADFHARTWFLSQLKPGIVILHDVRLHHFFDGIYRQRLGDQEQHLVLIERYYGMLGREAGRLYWRDKIFIDYMAKQFPMLGWAAHNALAVVVHSRHALEAVERQAGAPIWQNTLPYPGRAPLHVAAEEKLAVVSEKFSAERPARLVVFGYLNANRRVIEFLEALAALEERAMFEVHVYGELWQRYELAVKETVERFGLHDRVIFHGYVSDEELDAGIARSDLAVNLRYPTMGEASGSLLRIWDHTLPSLVTQTDAYADLPAETVCFVRPEHERDDIQRHLRDFLARPEAFRRMGEQGRRVLLSEHRPETYVERLETLCEQLEEMRSSHTRIQAAERTGACLAAWHEVGPMAREEYYASCVAGVF